jgi:hypothetical protein
MLILCGYEALFLTLSEEHKLMVEYKGFCEWYMTLRITGFLDVVHHLEFKIQENTTFR